MKRETVAELKLTFQSEGFVLSKMHAECECCGAVLADDNWNGLGFQIIAHLLADCPTVVGKFALGESNSGVTPL